MGTIYPIRKSRLHVSVGAGPGEITYPVHYHWEQGVYYNSHYYTVTNKVTREFNILLQTCWEFPVFKAFGMYAHATAYGNKHAVSVNAGVGCMIGKL
ncbi:MAG: hypothetical protein GC181_09330 [Bacteroidetes bacterium]|nr:hypothetical protein [Bacteroidota bacterium]